MEGAGGREVRQHKAEQHHEVSYACSGILRGHKAPNFSGVGQKSHGFSLFSTGTLFGRAKKKQKKIPIQHASISNDTIHSSGISRPALRQRNALPSMFRNKRPPRLFFSPVCLIRWPVTLYLISRRLFWYAHEEIWGYIWCTQPPDKRQVKIFDNIFNDAEGNGRATSICSRHMLTSVIELISSL